MMTLELVFLASLNLLVLNPVTLYSGFKTKGGWSL